MCEKTIEQLVNESHPFLEKNRFIIHIPTNNYNALKFYFHIQRKFNSFKFKEHKEGTAYREIENGGLIPSFFYDKKEKTLSFFYLSSISNAQVILNRAAHLDEKNFEILLDQENPINQKTNIEDLNFKKKLEYDPSSEPHS